MSLPGCFLKVLRNRFFVKSNLGFHNSLIARHSSLWEPDYLILAKTKTPEYDQINIQIKGYDFAVLEKFQSQIRKMARIMDINIVKSWPAPQQDLDIHHYKENSTEIQYKYQLQVHERNVQVIDVKSHIMPLLIETIVTTCPPGVKISVHEHEQEMEENRYVPNLVIKELQEVLADIGSTKLKKRKKIMKRINRV